MEEKRGYKGDGEMDPGRRDGDPGPDGPDTGCSCSDEPVNLLNFSTFILSLTTSMLVSLGELPDPLTNDRCVNLALAKQTVGIIEMLQEKTRGNLTEEEERLMESVLFDLRMKYVNAATCH